MVVNSRSLGSPEFCSALDGIVGRHEGRGRVAIGGNVMLNGGPPPNPRQLRPQMESHGHVGLFEEPAWFYQ